MSFEKNNKKRRPKNQMTQEDSDGNRGRVELFIFGLGSVFVLVGVIFLWLKANSAEYLDAKGILHENFFLLPIGFLFLLCGCGIVLIVGGRILYLHYRREKETKKM